MFHQNWRKDEEFLLMTKVLWNFWGRLGQVGFEPPLGVRVRIRSALAEPRALRKLKYKVTTIFELFKTFSANHFQNVLIEICVESTYYPYYSVAGSETEIISGNSTIILLHCIYVEE